MDLLSTSAPRPKLNIEMDRDLPEGKAICVGQAGFGSTINVPAERPPAGTTTVYMSIEDYGRLAGSPSSR